MNQNLSRWMQIVFLDENEISVLHAREKWLATRLPKCANSPRFQVEGKQTWMGLQIISQAMNRLNPSGYWPKNLTESERELRITNFERNIYPIWRSIEENDLKSNNALTMKEVEAPGQVMFECSTLHRQDLGIRARGGRPDTSIVASSDFRKKSAASDRYSGWNDR